MNESNAVVSAQDYDMWGYLIGERSYDADTSKYKFTGKERDRESNYDYFGARYYDARIGRWGSIDPMLEKHYDFNPYNYVLDNTLKFIDPEGKQVAPYGDSMYHINKEIGNDINNWIKKYEKLNKEWIMKYKEFLEPTAEFFSGLGLKSGVKFVVKTLIGYTIAEELVFKYKLKFWGSGPVGAILSILIDPDSVNTNEEEKIKAMRKEEETYNKQKESEGKNSNKNAPDRLYIVPPRIKWYTIGTTYY